MHASVHSSSPRSNSEQPVCHRACITPQSWLATHPVSLPQNRRLCAQLHAFCCLLQTMRTVSAGTVPSSVFGNSKWANGRKGAAPAEHKLWEAAATARHKRSSEANFATMSAAPITSESRARHGLPSPLPQGSREPQERKPGLCRTTTMQQCVCVLLSTIYAFVVYIWMVY